MEPLNDKELSDLLHQWQAPPAPASLEEKILSPAAAAPWWRWLLSGSIRVPVPALAAALLLLLAYAGFSVRREISPPRTVTLADFQPVKQLQPRIIRSAYEDR